MRFLYFHGYLHCRFLLATIYIYIYIDVVNIVNIPFFISYVCKELALFHGQL